MGGYNSGKFDFGDKHESVIHKNYVYAECGTKQSVYSFDRKCRKAKAKKRI